MPIMRNVLANPAVAERQQLLSPLYGDEPAGISLPEYCRMPGSAIGSVRGSRTPLLYSTPQLDPAAHSEAVREFVSSLRLIEHGSNSYEIGTIAADTATDEWMLHISSYSSAGTTNPGNAAEVAD